MAAIDDASVAFQSLVRSTRLTGWSEAELIHVIRLCDVQTAPRLVRLMRELALEAGDWSVVIHKVPFGLVFLPGYLRTSLESAAICAMEAFALHVVRRYERQEGFRWCLLVTASSIAEHF